MKTNNKQTDYNENEAIQLSSNFEDSSNSSQKNSNSLNSEKDSELNNQSGKNARGINSEDELDAKETRSFGHRGEQDNSLENARSS